MTRDVRLQVASHVGALCLRARTAEHSVAKPSELGKATESKAEQTGGSDAAMHRSAS